MINQCYQCKKSISTLLKLRYLSLESGYYCPHCRNELSFSLPWALLCILTSIALGPLLAAYVNQLISTDFDTALFVVVWLAVTLVGILLTVSFLPLKPYKDWGYVIFIVWMVVMFGLGFTAIIYGLLGL
ncbi:MAG: hypothetical protein COA90_08725 [Gammaproteobacteria bacterium]|nr:MAG: hypothetical protein COA90_08725 [Gammaproteobacteria bacterium]